MPLYLALDTSNYTTSAALFDSETRSIIHRKKLLPVKPGERGIRQSDAVFHHTQQLREILPVLLAEAGVEKTQIAAVGASAFPRRAEGSYMPCFTVGLTAASVAASVLGVPLREFSHQEGHIAAALYSADKLSMIGSEFLAFHVSGGTTESLFVAPSDEHAVKAEIIGTSTDLKAGQAIDRVGVMLGLNFPCGPELEKLALKSNAVFKIKPSASGLDCSLSGLENKCIKMLGDGVPCEDIALFCLKYIEASLVSMAEQAVLTYPVLPVVYSGGVMSNGLIREALKKVGECYFAEPEFSSDNAAGVAILTAWKDDIWKQ